MFQVYQQLFPTLSPFFPSLKSTLSPVSPTESKTQSPSSPPLSPTENKGGATSLSLPESLDLSNGVRLSLSTDVKDTLAKVSLSHSSSLTLCVSLCVCLSLMCTHLNTCVYVCACVQVDGVASMTKRLRETLSHGTLTHTAGFIPLSHTRCVSGDTRVLEEAVQAVRQTHPRTQTRINTHTQAHTRTPHSPR